MINIFIQSDFTDEELIGIRSKVSRLLNEPQTQAFAVMLKGMVQSINNLLYDRLCRAGKENIAADNKCLPKKWSHKGKGLKSIWKDATGL